MVEDRDFFRGEVERDGAERRGGVMSTGMEVEEGATSDH